MRYVVANLLLIMLKPRIKFLHTIAYEWYANKVKEIVKRFL